MKPTGQARLIPLVAAITLVIPGAGCADRKRLAVRTTDLATRGVRVDADCHQIAGSLRSPPDKGCPAPEATDAPRP